MPGAYYSAPASLVFAKLEAAVNATRLSPRELAHMATDLEHLLPSPTEAEIEQAFATVTERVGLAEELRAIPGKRVALRMVVTIANTLSRPFNRESGVMRLPQTIRGLFETSRRKNLAPTTATPSANRKPSCRGAGHSAQWGLFRRSEGPVGGSGPLVWRRLKISWAATV